MAAALNAFMKIRPKAGDDSCQGESKQGAAYTGWIELQSWEWEVEAESSWTKGSGSSVGKPTPGKMSWEHYWDRSSNTVLAFICKGMSFAEIELHMCKSTGKGSPEPYWKAKMEQAFITKVNQSASDEGNVAQKVEMVFKTIEIEYWQQGENAANPGALKQANHTKWDIEKGEVST